MDIFNEFATDSTLEMEGRWVVLGKGARALIAREGNDNYVREVRHLLEKHQVDLSAGGDESEELAQRLVRQAMAKHILLDMEGVTFKGKAVKYTPKLGEEMLEIKDFRRRVEEYSRDFQGYKVKVEAETGKD